MAVKQLPSQTELESLFNYNEHSGVFVWKIKCSDKICIGDIAGCEGKDGYIQIQFDKNLYKAHRLAWKYHYGVEPEQHIDHINGNKSDNRISNLREATTIENGRNSKKFSTNSSGFKGVTYHKVNAKWMSQANVNGERIYLGYFDTPEEASIVYIKFTKKHFGEFYKDLE